MPCDSSHLEPNEREKESVRVRGFLRELGSKIMIFDPYGKPELLDRDTAELCQTCQEVDVTNYSLELQIWWRDHQKADKKKLEEDLKQKTDLGEREAFLKELSPYERNLLGEVKAIFRVQAKATTYAYLDIEADSEDEAMEIANSTDGGDFITDDNQGNWEIIFAEKQQDA